MTAFVPTAHCSREITKICPNLPQEEIKVDMMVIARRRPMRWQRGKIVEIITKGKFLLYLQMFSFTFSPDLLNERLFLFTDVVLLQRTDG